MSGEDLLLGGIIGALLFGGGSSTTAVNEGHAKGVPGAMVAPTVIGINKKTKEVLLTCPECGGAGMKEYSYSNYSSSVPSENGTFHHRLTCHTCEGNKTIKIKVEKELWQKALKIQKK